MAQLTRYIDASRPSSGDGLSWETAWNNLNACWGSCDTPDDYTIYLRGGTDNVPRTGGGSFNNGPGSGWDTTTSVTFIGDWTSLDVFDPNCYRWRGDPNSANQFSFFVIGQSNCVFTFKNFVAENYPTKITASGQALFKAYQTGALGQQVTLDGCAFIMRGTLDLNGGGAFMAQAFANVVAQNCVFVARPTTVGSNVSNVLINHDQGANIRIANCIADSVLDNGSPAVMSNFGSLSSNQNRTTAQVTNCVSVRRGDRDFAYINEVRNCASGNNLLNCPNTSDNVTIANEADRLALFVDAANGNFAPANPGNGQGPFDLVDTGRDSSVETGISTDYYGNDRNDPLAGDAWDIGPYEWGFAAEPSVPPTITTTTLNAMTVGAAFSQTLAATGDTPITFATQSGSIPAGLSLASSGAITGTPTTEGAYSWTVRATNVAGFDDQLYTGTVAAEPPTGGGSNVIGGAFRTLGAPSAPTYPDRRVTIDRPYTADLSAGWKFSDGSDFTIDALPTGLSMSTAGIVTGTPTVLPEVTVSTVSHMGLSSNAFTWTVVTRPPSGTLADAKFDALRDQGFTGSISDMTLQWLQANGATSGSITDAWLEVLPGTGQRNDRWYTVLGGMGYTGSLNDREFAFWVDGGVLPGTVDVGPANLEAFLISEGWGVTRTGEDFVVRSGVHEWLFTWSEAEAGVYEQDLPAPLRNDIDDSFGR